MSGDLRMQSHDRFLIRRFAELMLVFRKFPFMNTIKLSTSAQGARLGVIKRALSRNRRAAFSLIELLVVLGVISVLSVLGATVLSTPGDMNRAVLGIGLTLEQARAHAMAHNTYVWVGFYKDAAEGSVSVATVAGTTGSAQDIVNSSTYLPVSRASRYGQVSLQAVDGLAGMETADDADTSNLGSFSQQTGGVVRNFSSVIRFSPSGEVAIRDGELSRWVQVGIRQTVNVHQVAAFQVEGLTGKVQIFRP